MSIPMRHSNLNRNTYAILAVHYALVKKTQILLLSYTFITTGAHKTENVCAAVGGTIFKHIIICRRFGRNAWEYLPGSIYVYMPWIYLNWHRPYM